MLGRGRQELASVLQRISFSAPPGEEAGQVVSLLPEWQSPSGGQGGSTWGRVKRNPGMGKMQLHQR